VNGSDAVFRELINDLLIMSKQVQGLRAALAKQLHVSEPQYRVLLTVAKLQGDAGVSVTAVAKQLRVTGAFVTVEGGKLVTYGFLQKQEDVTDRRSVLLSLTPQGNTALAAFATRAQAVNDELFRGLTPDEFLSLTKMVSRLVANGERAELVARALASGESDRDFVRRVSSRHQKQSKVPPRLAADSINPTIGRRVSRN
jgi:DNA-binding MarR family transcriptional regulator